MKKLFTILAVAATLVSCAKEDVVREAAREAIGFDNAFVENATRSVFDPSYTNTETGIFADFQVYGYVEGQPLFNKEDTGAYVSKSVPNGDLSSAWKYEGTQYWIPGAKYNFSAVAPVNHNSWTDTAWEKTASSKDGVSLSFTNNGLVDLLYAQTPELTRETNGDKFVKFTFRHLLSKVKFSFLNNYNADNTTIQVRDIKVTNAFNTGKVALTATTTTWSDWATNLELEFGNAAEDAVNALEPFAVDGEVESYNELLLIPYNYDGTTNAKLAVEFTYDILVGGEDVATFKVEPKVAVNLEPGHAYDFKATITPGEPIEFTVLDITDWDSDLDNNGTNGDETPIQ